MRNLFSFTADTENDTAAFAARLSACLLPGDVLLLEGTLGAGKSAFCRAFIRAIAQNPEEEVPSPTFTLVQLYEHLPKPVWHFDLYRLSEPDEVIELGWEDALDSAILLIEWPDRLEDLRPATALTLSIALQETASGEEIRQMTLTGDAEHWAPRLAEI